MTATVPAQGLNNALSKYYFDPLYQLTRADYPSGAPFNGESHSWTYDAIGNRLSNTVNGSTQMYTYLKNGANPLNGQRLSSDGVNAYTWDANGSNLTRNGTPGNFTFGYDLDNRLTSITGATAVSYTYDYKGRRTSKSVGGVTTTYFYDGLNLVSETSDGTVANYVFGPRIDEPLAQFRGGQISYLAAEGLGTVSATTDPAGNASLSTAFDAWGNTKAETGTRLQSFTYTGRESGEAGFLFYRARYYQPGTGRFTQEDPIGPTAYTQNLYPYALNKPVEFQDPSGMEATSTPDTCPPCTEALPLEASSPACDKYGPELYGATSLKCFCKCAGNGSWATHVRGCLACEHDRGTNKFTAHMRCYKGAGPDWPLPTLTACFYQCLRLP